MLASYYYLGKSLFTNSNENAPNIDITVLAPLVKRNSVALNKNTTKLIKRHSAVLDDNTCKLFDNNLQLKLVIIATYRSNYGFSDHFVAFD